MTTERPIDRSKARVSALVTLLSPASVLRPDEPLAKRTTLRVGGPADIYVEPANEADLAAVLHFCREENLPVLMLGRGSNLLVKDGGVRGMVICLAHANFCTLEFDGVKIKCGAGVKLKQLAVEARRRGIAGLEFLEGIPGNVGGALRMNAGAMGGATFDALVSMRFMDFDGNIFERVKTEIPVSYRNCAMLKNHVALSAVFEGRAGSLEEIEQRMSGFSRKRWDSQPAAPSAGCIFKNPAAIPAGRLVDELNLKGARVGGAVVSQEHGNFIVNDGKATARDVLQLIEHIRQRAKAERGVDLETEVQIVGED